MNRIRAQYNLIIVPCILYLQYVVCCILYHIVSLAPAYSTERTELFQLDEVRTATLDLKNRRNRPPASTPVPFADFEDDSNVSPYTGKVRRLTL